jgi:hypothetical protein
MLHIYIICSSSNRTAIPYYSHRLNRDLLDRCGPPWRRRGNNTKHQQPGTEVEVGVGGPASCQVLVLGVVMHVICVALRPLCASARRPPVCSATGVRFIPTATALKPQQAPAPGTGWSPTERGRVSWCCGRARRTRHRHRAAANSLKSQCVIYHGVSPIVAIVLRQRPSHSPAEPAAFWRKCCRLPPPRLCLSSSAASTESRWRGTGFVAAASTWGRSSTATIPSRHCLTPLRETGLAECRG